jgi:5-methylcytosine-specific restriction endonuclease McrA
MPEISVALRAEVRSRAKGRCEYCLVPESLTLVEHEVDHIIAAKHGGRALLDNLVLCCTLCNKYRELTLLPLTLRVVR